MGEFWISHLIENGPKVTFARRARGYLAVLARGARAKFFIAFLAELGNFKHFEPYFFLAIFGDIWRPPDRQIGDLAIFLQFLQIFCKIE